MILILDDSSIEHLAVYSLSIHSGHAAWSKLDSDRANEDQDLVLFYRELMMSNVQNSLWGLNRGAKQGEVVSVMIRVVRGVD